MARPYLIQIPVESRLRLRDVLRQMVYRCSVPTHISFANYGARGIRVCREWQESCKVFIQWAIENGWRPGLQIDRKDNDGDYEPGNCRWVTPSQNRQNIGPSRRSQFKGIRQRGDVWHAQIHIPGSPVCAKRQLYLGTFHSPEDAARAYDNKAREIYGEFANLNFKD